MCDMNGILRDKKKKNVNKYQFKAIANQRLHIISRNADITIYSTDRSMECK